MHEPPIIGQSSPAGVPRPVPPSPAEAVRATRAALNGPFNDSMGADGVGPERDFTLRYVGIGDRLWTGDFRIKVLTVRDTIQIGLVKARLAGGVPLADLDPNTAYVLEVIAHLSVAVIQSPPWAKDLMNVYDSGVLAAIYGEVTAHEARFRGTGRPEAGGVDDKRPAIGTVEPGAGPHASPGVP